MSLDVVHKVGPLALPPPAKAVLVVLAVHANADGSNCYPSVERLCTFTSYKASAIYDALKQLLALKLIERVQAPARGSYAINLDMVAQLQPSSDADPSKASADESAQRTRKKREPVRSADSKVRSADSKVRAAESGVHSADPYIKNSESHGKTLKEESARERAAVPDAKAKGKAAQGKRKSTPKPTPEPTTKLEAPSDVDPQVWTDFLALRKAKSAPVTPTVLRRARKEAALAGDTLQAFLEIWCARGSQGLEAAWLKNQERGHRPSRLTTAERHEQAVLDAVPGLARPDAGLFGLPQAEIIDADR